MTPTETIGAVLFALALVHTFSTRHFERLAHRRPQHAGVWHLLGEVEVVFGFWAMVLVVAIALLQGPTAATDYLDSRNFTEPMFVFAIMVVAGSRAVLAMARSLVLLVARAVPLAGGAGFYVVALSLVPLLGSLITEPAAMTLAAMLLRDRVLADATLSRTLRYATIGVLFVNVSIGGTLTPFAAPPVLMVAATWQWDLWHMLGQFGWKAAIAVFVNAIGATIVFRRELAQLPRNGEGNGNGNGNGEGNGNGNGSGNGSDGDGPAERLPRWVGAVHLAFLGGVVAFAHHPPVFMGLLLFFLGFATAYPQFQERLLLREGLLVAFFLAGLVVLGGQQQWWLEPLLRGMDADVVFWAAAALTAITDNAALTYLGSLVEGLSDEFKYALVAGAVTGGGLTVIANAPNPAGYSILRGSFEDEAIHPLGLLLSALPPTVVAAIALRFL